VGGVGDILPPPHARAEKAIVSNQNQCKDGFAISLGKDLREYLN
jgi:hypothetical protein